MKGSKLFEERIKEYLDKKSYEDSLFTPHYNKAGKSIEKCCEYILREVSASGQNGFDDDEIYGMAVHYYTEDNVEIKKNNVSKVVVDYHVELTEEENSEARKQAIKSYQDKVLEDMKRKPASKPKEETKEEPQLSLF